MGAAKRRHTVRAALCIDCGVCGNLCPKSAVSDAEGRPVPKMKLSQRPKPCIDVELCSGCEACASICPQRCIALEPFTGRQDFFPVAAVDRKRCIGCGLCETICIKEAVTLSSNGQPPASG